MANNRTQKSGLTFAKNALRPFFNSKRHMSRWQQFQTIRQQIGLHELAELYRLTEERPFYKFDGLGNTFPKNPGAIPDSTLRRLSPMPISRELRLQIARLNHHAVPLAEALRSLANISDHLRAGEWLEAENAIVLHRAAHGLSLALLRRDLLSALQTSGLRGLSRRYTSTIEGFERRSWGLLAHVVYDIMDPAYNPERATRTWLASLSRRSDLGEHYARLVSSELLTAWPSKDDLAASLLRYSACSLLDLVLCLWKARCVHEDWPELSAAWEILDSSISNILDERFSALYLNVPERYYLGEDGPADVDVYRLSFLFQDDKPIAQWRNQFAAILYPFITKVGSPPSVTGVIEPLAITGLDRPNTPREIVDFVESILPKSGTVSDFQFTTSVFVAAYLREVDESNVIPNDIVRLSAAAENLHEYMTIDSIKRLLSFSLVQNDKLCTYLLHDLIFRRQRTQDHELERRAAFMAMFTVGGRGEIIPFLNDLARWAPRAAEYIALACTRGFLERLYLIVSSVKDVVEARIDICDWLLTRDVKAHEAIREERGALERELSNLDARSDLDSTRVHVDEESLREWYVDTQRSREARYKQTVMAEGPSTGHSTFLDFYNKSREKAEVGEESEDFLSDTQIGSEFILLAIVEATLRAFVSDKSFGLDAYLSRRIRHGTLRGFLTTPINRIIRRLIEESESEERAAEQDDYLVVINKLSAWRDLFSERLDYLRREVIQIHDDKHPGGLIEATWRTYANVRHLDAMMSRTRSRVLDARGDYDVFSDVHSLCWDILERDLAQLRVYLIREFLREMISELGLIFDTLDYDQGVIGRVAWTEVHTTLQARLHEVCGWFIRPVFRRDEYDLGTLVDSTISIVRELDDTYKFVECVEVDSNININRGGFDVIGDILFVLIGNAAKHGKKGGTITIKAFHTAVPGVISLSVSSQVEDMSGFDTSVERIKSAANVSDDELIQSAGVIEGFSGIRKIMGLLARVRSEYVKYAVGANRSNLTIDWAINIPALITFARERT